VLGGEVKMTTFIIDDMECSPVFNELGECGGCEAEGEFMLCEDCSLTGKCPMHGNGEED